MWKGEPYTASVELTQEIIEAAVKRGLEEPAYAEEFCRCLNCGNTWVRIASNTKKSCPVCRLIRHED